MNITFFIGNGFDINLGLPTKYSDFLLYHNSKGYTDIVSTSMREDISLWSDVESELGDFTKNVTTDSVETFLDAKDNVDRSLIEYLNTILGQYKLTINAEGVVEFRDKIVGFSKEFNRDDREQLDSLIQRTTIQISYRFITFNYTDYLDTIVKKAKELGPFSTHKASSTIYNDIIHDPFHVHGTLGSDMILGVNDRSQLACSDEVSGQISEYMIKTDLNSALGERKVALAKEIIDGSGYICVFGMSLGKTDLIWWKYIFEWLKQNSNRRLVLYKLFPTSSVAAASAIARRRNSVRREFLKLVEAKDEDEKIGDQIILVPNSKIFTFEKIKVEKKDG